jgi:leader peptidase (prepilin peptidase)/N-methyltransferase
LVLLIIAGIFFSGINLSLGETVLVRFLNSMLGILGGGGILLVLGILGKIICKKEVIGGGDIKLMSGIGAFIGWEKGFFVIFLAAFIASVIMGALLFLNKIERKNCLPFAPYLSIASFAALFMPQPSNFLSGFFSWEAELLSRFL